jgi:hypothetical protein
MPSHSRLKRATLIVSLIVAAVLSGSFPALGKELKGYKGDRLKGSISCVYPNLVRDLIERISDAKDFTFVLRIYLQQGYCLEADIPTTLAKPMADQTFRTWDGHEAEIWQTALRFDRGEGTSETVESFSIVFPREMELSFDD